MARSMGTVMKKLIGLVKPLLHIMVTAIGLGVTGHLCAIFITVSGGVGLLKISGFSVAFSLRQILVFMAFCAVLRGVFRYGEQMSNHYIAFKLLAAIRHKVFVQLRKLGPARLEGRDKGNLISLITSDIELLEVFYAHTVSPAAIAVITSLIMTVMIGRCHIFLGIIALAAYLTVGVLLPVIFSKAGAVTGQEYRNEYGKMNSFFLDSIRGLRESIQFGQGEKRLEEINQMTQGIEEKQERLKKVEGLNRAVTDSAVLLFSFIMLFTGILLYQKGGISFEAVIISVIAMMSSFGPVVALSSLSSNLHLTIASGNRILDLLEEEPIVSEITGKAEDAFGDIRFEQVSFSYEREENNSSEQVLDKVSLEIPRNKITGIHGESGSGKSTLLKLIMRFWETEKGEVLINRRNINQINTKELRDMEAYVTQDTYLFNDTLAANIGIGKENASRGEIIMAAKKASIDEFIQSLPEGYDTRAGELGEHLSGGERQRIGIARAFLHDAPLVLLDEPTSNLDSLNEAVILKALKEEGKNKTIVLVSHRQSTMNIADKVILVGE